MKKIRLFLYKFALYETGTNPTIYEMSFYFNEGII